VDREWLEAWGWDDDWADRLARLTAEPVDVARVVGQDRARWSVRTRSGAESARVATGSELDPYPVVGDWVVVESGPAPADPRSIVAVLPRRSSFSRGVAGSGASEHVLAANVDVVWVVHGLDAPVHPRRIERYLTLAWESGARPEVVLTKSDLAEDPEAAAARAREIAIGVEVRVVSAREPRSGRELRASLAPGRTVVLLGPSGVGKSTLVNLLAGTELAATGAVRAGDRKGRHTTTRRELFRLEGGALLLDTPGLRELRVWEVEEGLERAFPEIRELARSCRFRDCRHESEPGCAVLEAAASGRLDEARLESFRKLRAEADHQRRKSDPRARAEAVAGHKTALKTLKYHPKYRGRS
jgi:ribosome biogenesis GTPase